MALSKKQITDLIENNFKGMLVRFLCRPDAGQITIPGAGTGHLPAHRPQILSSKFIHLIYLMKKEVYTIEKKL